MNTKIDNLKPLIVEIEKIKNSWDFKTAIQLIEKAILTYNEDYRLYEELADSLIYMWEIEKAKKAINHALKINPDSATWNYLKWFICLNEEKYKEWLAHLEKSNKLMGNNPEVLRNLGWAYTMNNQVRKWIMILKRALVLAPWDKLISEDLAMALIWIWEIEAWNEILEKIWLKRKIVK